MKALISSNETISLANGLVGIRICEIQQDKDIFPVNDALFWVDCDKDIVPDNYYWDGKNIILKPQEAILETPAP